MSRPRMPCCRVLFAVLVAVVISAATPAARAQDDSAAAENPAAATTTQTTTQDTEQDPDQDTSQAGSETAQQIAQRALEESEGIDYAAWETFAGRVEAALESGRVSDSVLGDLRRDLVDWRATFGAAKNKSSVRIQALKAQLAALPTVDADSGSELAGIAAQRAALEAELDRVLTPVTRANLAYTRADTLIATVDQTLRSRQVRDVSSTGPSPFNVGSWLPAVESLQRTFRLASSAAIASWSNTSQRKTLIADLPLTIPLGIAGLVMLLFGWRSVRRIGERLRAGKPDPVRGAWGFVISALQVWVPSFGALLLGAAVSNAFVLDTRGDQLVSAFINIVAVQFIARWLGNRVFGIPGASWRVLELSGGEVRAGHAMAATLGILVGLQMLLIDLGRIDAYSEATMAVLNFPLIVMTSMVLWRLGRMLRRYRRAADPGDEADRTTAFYNNTVRLIGTLLTLVAFAAPVVAALGFRQLAIFILFPSVYSLALIALLMILHYFIVDLYALVSRRDRAEAAQSLVPALVSVGVGIMAMPVVPLIWGYRVSDLTEFWGRVWGGISIGGTVITPMTVLTVGVVFAIGFALTRLVQGMLASTILPKTGMEPAGQMAVTSGVGYVGIFIAALAAVTAAGINLSSLAIVAGALSVGIGFGLQNIVSNFVSGIILLIERPIGIGDWIEVGTTMGTVKDISVRSTTIETFDRTDVIVPNSDLISGTVTNYTRGNLLGRVIVPVGVAYGTDTRRVQAILLEIAQAHPLVTIKPEPKVVFQGFGADSLDFEVRVILRDVNFMLEVRTELNHQIAKRFAEEGIEIPFAQRDIWLRNPEALWRARASGSASGGAPEARAEPAETEQPPIPADGAAARRAIEPEDLPASHGYGPEDRDDD